MLSAPITRHVKVSTHQTRLTYNNYMKVLYQRVNSQYFTNSIRWNVSGNDGDFHLQLNNLICHTDKAAVPNYFFIFLEFFDRDMVTYR